MKVKIFIVNVFMHESYAKNKYFAHDFYIILKIYYISDLFFCDILRTWVLIRIIVRGSQHLFSCFRCACANPVSDERLQNRKNRDCENHTDHAGDFSADEDGNDNPESA